MASFNMLDFFASSPPEYIPPEIQKLNQELLEQLAARNGGRESLATADRNPERGEVMETEGWALSN